MAKNTALKKNAPKKASPDSDPVDLEELKRSALDWAVIGRGAEVEERLKETGKEWLIFSVVGELGRLERRARVHEEEKQLAAVQQGLIDCAPALGRAARAAFEGVMGPDYASGWLAHLSEIRFPQEAFKNLLAFAGEDLVRSVYEQQACDQSAGESALNWASVFQCLPGFAERFVQEAEKAWPSRGDCPYPPRWTLGIAQLRDSTLVERCWREGERLGLDMGRLSLEGQETAEGVRRLPGTLPSALGLALLNLDADCAKAIASFCPPGSLTSEVSSFGSDQFDRRSSRDRKRLAEIASLAEAIELGMSVPSLAKAEGNAPRL